jgi:hypothetical protein
VFFARRDKEHNKASATKNAHRCRLGFTLYAGKNNVNPKDITEVYISHQHSDHVGGLEFLGFSRYDWMSKPSTWEKFKSGFSAPILIANNKLMQDLWDSSLRGGMSSLEDLDATLSTYFCPAPIQPNQSFLWCGWKCSLIQQIHIMTGSIITNTFGLFMEKAGHPSVYFVTDSQHCSPRQIEIFYRKADIIFQDCECVGVDTLVRQSKFMSGVHANFAQLAGWQSANSVKLPDNIKAKMRLAHYQDFVSNGIDMFGNKCDWQQLAYDEGFPEGFATVGQTLEI